MIVETLISKYEKAKKALKTVRPWFYVGD